MPRAWRKGDTVLVAAFAYSAVVFGSILDTLFFNMKMSITAWIGMLITVLAGVLVSLRAAQITRSNGK